MAGLTLGQFLERGRAEVETFLALRPLLLPVLVIVALNWAGRTRWPAYVGALLLATASEAVLVGLLGAPEPLRGALRGVAAGLALLAIFDVAGFTVRRLLAFFARRCRVPHRHPELVSESTAPQAMSSPVEGWMLKQVQHDGELRGRGALPRIAAFVALAALLALPITWKTYERIALPAASAVASNRPSLAIMTGLPLFWGERDIASALGEKVAPEPALAVLETAFTVRPVDSIEELDPATLLLLAQPRPPGPAGLVTLDRWVRDGGQVLILADPALRWPSRWPHGDLRRPPADHGLDPLIAHWGLSVEPSADGLADRRMGGFRLMLASPGRFTRRQPGCRIEAGGLVADCAIGRGRAILVADADLLHPLLWAGPGEIGTTRAGRTADNLPFLIHLLDRLRGEPAARVRDSIAWIDPADSPGTAILGALLGPILILSVGLALLRRAQDTSGRKDSDRLIHKREARPKQEQ